MFKSKEKTNQLIITVMAESNADLNKIKIRHLLITWFIKKNWFFILLNNLFEQKCFTYVLQNFYDSQFLHLEV